MKQEYRKQILLFNNCTNRQIENNNNYMHIKRKIISKNVNNILHFKMAGKLMESNV